MENTNTQVLVKQMNYVDDEYAWVECFAGNCHNTVKFDGNGSVGCCPACGQMYIRVGDTALLDD